MRLANCTRKRHAAIRTCLTIIAVLLPAGLQAIAQAPVPVVGVMPVGIQDVAPGTEFVGRVEALNAVDIRARVEGFIEARPFQEGQMVGEGQDLYRIEPAPYEAALSDARARLAGAEATLRDAEGRLQRNRELRRTQTVAQATLEEIEATRDTALANVMSAKAAVSQAELNLSYTNIKAPMAGQIGRATFSVGSLVGPSSEPLARIVQEDPIRVVFSVSDRTILELRAGAGGLSKEEIARKYVPTLRLSSGDIYPANGEIEFFGNEIDPQTGTLPIRARFPNANMVLVPGQFVTVVVRPAQSLRRPVVPLGAVQLDRDGRFVLLADGNNKVAVRRIRVGAQVGQKWVVEEGLEGGENLIVQGFQNARPGTIVRVIAAVDALATTGQTSVPQ